MPRIALVNRIYAAILFVFALNCSGNNSSFNYPEDGISPSQTEHLGISGISNQLIMMNEILVRLHESVRQDSLSQMVDSINATIVGSIADARMIQLRFPNSSNDQGLLYNNIAKIASNEIVEQVTENSILEALSIPDDGYRGCTDICTAGSDACNCQAAWDTTDIRNKTWGLAAVQAPNAWDLSTGSKDQTIGIVDVGFQANHEDLTPRAVIQLSASNGGRVHGTHVAGIIGAKGNNGIGVAGMNWNAKLNLYQINAFINPDGTSIFCNSMTTQAISQLALTRALGHGDRLINISLGYQWATNNIECEILGIKFERPHPCYPADNISQQWCPTQKWIDDQQAWWRPVVDLAKKRQALLVLGAGNNSDPAIRRVDSKWSGGLQALAPEYPENIITVAAVGNPDNQLRSYFSDWAQRWDAISSFSSIGPSIDVAAPGAAILSLADYDATTTEHTRYLSGTSMAAPFVTGIASLLWARFPDLTAAQVKKYIVKAAQSVGPQVYRGPDRNMPDERYSFHVANAFEALRQAGCERCSASEICNAGKCVCKPTCGGNVCGPDGCGGVCGNCNTGEACQSGRCVHVPCGMEAFLNGLSKTRCAGGSGNFGDCPNFLFDFTNCLCAASCMSQAQCQMKLQGGFSMTECQSGTKTQAQLIAEMSSYLSTNPNYCWSDFGGTKYGKLTLQPIGDCSSIPTP